MSSKIVGYNNVVILGSLNPQKTKNKDIISCVASVCKANNYSTYSPLDLSGLKLEDKEYFNQMQDAILKCDFIIADINCGTEMSINVAIMLGLASRMEKSIIILSKSQSSIAKLIKGLPNVVRTIFYENTQDLSENLNNFLTYGNFKK